MKFEDFSQRPPCGEIRMLLHLGRHLRSGRKRNFHLQNRQKIISLTVLVASGLHQWFLVYSTRPHLLQRENITFLTVDTIQRKNS